MLAFIIYSVICVFGIAALGHAALGGSFFLHLFNSAKGYLMGAMVGLVLARSLIGLLGFLAKRASK